MFAFTAPYRLSAVAPRAALLLVVTSTLLMGVGCQTATKKKVTAPNPIVDEFAAAKDRQPTTRTLYAMSRVLVARNQTEQARYVLERVIQDDPTFVAAYCDLAELQLRGGHAEDAIATLDQAFKHSPDDPILHNNMGICWLMRKDYDKAAEHFDIAVTAAPRNARFISNQATVQALRGQYDQALATYQQCMTAADAHYNLATILEHQGQTDQAAEQYRLAGEGR